MTEDVLIAVLESDSIGQANGELLGETFGRDVNRKE